MSGGAGPLPPGGAPGPGAHFQQMYYTSCEHGLSGFSGFQFNAVSEGVTAETRHAVEALAGYEPPRSMAESDTPELLGRCPVNLCYRPYGPAGQAATALCVQYVGRDSARRFGNYFAHALHSEDFTAAGRGLLGIELWGSPVWTRRTSPTTELPVLAAPARGPLDTRAVRGFLDAHPHAGQLPNLLAAVLAALTDHSSVVVADDTTDLVAHWFAGVCYLLPPPLARRLSFATYVLRPARSRLHLIGTVPEARLDFGPDEEDAYTVFDFSRGRFPPQVPADAGVRDLVSLLTRIGVGSVRPVWAWTKDFTHGREAAPADWHAPVAAAASSGGIALTATDVEALIDWLEQAAHLGPRSAAIAADLHRGHGARALGERQLAVLSDVARDAGDTALHQEIEGKLAEYRMRASMAGGEAAAPPVPIADPGIRGRAAAQWERILQTEAATARHRVRLLLWAHGSRLALDPGLVERETLALARTLLGSSAAGPGLRHEVARLVAAMPAMRTALSTAVEEALERREGQGQLFAQFPADLLSEADLGRRPLLLEHYWRARAEREPERTVELLLRILRVRGQAAPDAELLRALWRRPSPAWTYQESIGIVRGLAPDALRDETVGQWLDHAVNQWIDDEAQLDGCLDLCRVLAPQARFSRLPDSLRGRVRTTLRLAAELDEAREVERLVAAFSVPEAEQWSGPRALKRHRLVPAMLRLPADVGRLGELLPDTGHLLLELYLGAVGRAALSSGRIDDVVVSHVAAVAVMRPHAGIAQANRDLAGRIRAHPARRWRVADLERLERAVRPFHAALADSYRWSVEDRRSVPQKLARRLPTPWPSRRGEREERDGRRDKRKGRGGGGAPEDGGK